MEVDRMSLIEHAEVTLHRCGGREGTCGHMSLGCWRPDPCPVCGSTSYKAIRYVHPDQLSSRSDAAALLDQIVATWDANYLPATPGEHETLRPVGVALIGTYIERWKELRDAWRCPGRHIEVVPAQQNAGAVDLLIEAREWIDNAGDFMARPMDLLARLDTALSDHPRGQ